MEKIFLKNSQLKEFREKKLQGNDFKCEICGRTIDFSEAVVDHIHGSHKSMYPETNKLIRGVICSDCNVILGKIENQFLRSSKKYKEKIDLENVLKNISIYINKYKNKNNFKEQLVHPSEWKPKKIKKSSFNKFKKLVKEKFNKNVEYPKSGKVTKQLKILSEKIEFKFEYY